MVTIFDTSMNQVMLNLGLPIDDATISAVNNLKILKVSFESLVSISVYTTAITSKIQVCNKILTSLVALLATHRPIYELPGTSRTKLQTGQNGARRNATRYLLLSREHHLHSEAQMLSAKEHNIMHNKRFLLGCYRSD